jgi:hypothetical protein
MRDTTKRLAYQDGDTVSGMLKLYGSADPGNAGADHHHMPWLRGI